ncbi:MAG TPA: hypothetical protein VGD23_02280 [Sphingomicrobium sp.]
MIEALLLAAAQPAMSAIDAERAFVADAHKLGQWTAFRKWAAPDAIMFLPQAGNAQEWLKDKADPPVPVFWWPGRSYVSCDGNTAVNTGPWVRQWGKAVGYFTTVWQRQADGSWKWLLDHGDTLATPRTEGGDIKPVVASCEKPGPTSLPIRTDTVPERKVADGGGQSGDGTVIWLWDVQNDGSREFRTYLWNGKVMEQVIHDKVAASP